MSAGRSLSYLLIDERELEAEEIKRRYRRVLPEGEAQGLTPAQKQVWVALNFLLHRRSHGYREGYVSYAAIAEHCGIAVSTVVAAIQVFLDSDLLLRRRRRDPRGKGKSPFYAPNAYWLLPPPSVRTPEEVEMVTTLKELWAEDERLVRRRPTPAPPPSKEALPVEPIPTPAPPPSARDRQTIQDWEEGPARTEARNLVAEFHRAAGLGSHLGAAEIELARELIQAHGLDAVRDLARHVLTKDKPRSFVLLRYYVHRAKVVQEARATSVLTEALGARLEQLRTRLEALWAVVTRTPESPVVLVAMDLRQALDGFPHANFTSEDSAGKFLDSLERDVDRLESQAA